MWSVLNAIDRENKMVNEPSGDEFYRYFKGLSDVENAVCMNNSYEREARTFLENYDITGSINFDSEIGNYIINNNSTDSEIVSAIDALKNNKSQGIDAIPAEFLKHSKDILAGDIATILNYVIEKRNFPGIWAEGLRSGVFKSGKRNLVDNYLSGNYHLTCHRKDFRSSCVQKAVLCQWSHGENW